MGAFFLILKFQIVAPAGIDLTAHYRTPDNRGVKTTIKRKITSNNGVKLTHIQGVLNSDVELAEGTTFFTDLTVEHGEMQGFALRNQRAVSAVNCCTSHSIQYPFLFYRNSLRLSK